MVTLSLCVIVGAKESMELERLLKSATRSTALFDEILVTTTKNDENVRDIALKYATEVSHFEWIDDFAAARNYNLDRVRTSHFMWLDADDEIPQPVFEELVSRKDSLGSLDCVYLTYNYSRDEKGSITSMLPRERILRKLPEIRWHDAIHEFILVNGMHRRETWGHLAIEHRRQREYDPSRNLTILKKIYESGAASPRNKFYYAKDLFDSGDRDASLKIFKEFLTGPLDQPCNMAIACMKLAGASREEGDTNTEKQYLSRALIHDSGYAECYHRLGLIAEEEGHVDQALQYFTEATRKNPESNFASDPLYYHYYPYNAMMMIYDRQNRYHEALQCVRGVLRFYPEDKNSLYNQSYFEERLKQLGVRIGWAVPVLDESYGPLRIRTLALHRALCSKGVSSKLLVGFGTTPVKGLGVEDLSAQVDTLIISNYNENTLGWVKELKKQGIQIICDLCEDILDNGYVPQILKESDMVFCCSTLLSEKVSNFHEKVLVLEDPFEESQGDDYCAYNVLEGQRPRAGFVGMGGNSFLVTEYLRKTIEDAGYDLVVCTEWEDATDQWTLGSWQDTMKKCQVILCPQRVDIQPAKSNNRATQAMSFGIPVIASPLRAYAEVIHNGENGYICDSREEWGLALRNLLDENTRRRVGLAGKSSVSKYGASVLVDKMVKAIKEGCPERKICEEGHHSEKVYSIPIIIPVYNGIDYLRQCLTSIRKNTTTPYHVILSDAGSDQQTWSYMQAQKDVTVLGSFGERRSFSEAVNAGVAHCGDCQYFAVLNSDVIVSKGWTSGILRKMDTVPRLAACGVLSNCDSGWLFNAPGKPSHDMELKGSGVTLFPGMSIAQLENHLDALDKYMTMSNAENSGAFRSQPWVAYYATVFAKSAWNEIGGLDTIFKNGCEDLDHCRRLTSAGYTIGQALDSFVFHYGGISRGAYQAEDVRGYAQEDAYNHRVYTDKWSKKRVVIYTGPAWEPWDVTSVQEGMAGSETWAVEIAAQFSRKGFEVTIFNEPVNDGFVDDLGVTYFHYSHFLEWQKYRYIDHLILSRTCSPLQNTGIHAGTVDVMVHDIWLSSDRDYNTCSWRVRKFACLSEWHAEFFSKHQGIDRSQIWITANGVNPELYSDSKAFQKRNRAVYSSSPDRGLRELLQMLPRIREEIPDFELVVTYGFTNWESAARLRSNTQELARIEEIKSLMQQPGVIYLGRVSKKKLASLQKSAKVWLYPTWFSETWAISLVEQGFAGNAAITTPYAGILTTGGSAPIYIKGEGDHPEWWSSQEGYTDLFVKATIEMLKSDAGREHYAGLLKKHTEGYTWENAAKGWLSEWGYPQ